MGHTITVRLDKELAQWLERVARKTGLSQGQIVREQIEKARAAQPDRPFMKLVGSLRGLPRNLSSRKGFASK